MNRDYNTPEQDSRTLKQLAMARKYMVHNCENFLYPVKGEPGFFKCKMCGKMYTKKDARRRKARNPGLFKLRINTRAWGL